MALDLIKGSFRFEYEYKMEYKMEYTISLHELPSIPRTNMFWYTKIVLVLNLVPVVPSKGP